MSLITDELVEKCGRAAFEVFAKTARINVAPWESQEKRDRDEWCESARAALSVAVAEIVEACAKIADSFNTGNWCADDHDRGKNFAAEEIASSIRSLAK